MASYSTPGVYIQEIATLPASVAQVETAIPAFIGLTANAVVEPKRITSMVDFADVFGGPEESIITINIIDSSGVDIVDPTVAAPASDLNLYYHMQMYFSNGGGPCYVTSCGTVTADLTEAKIKVALGKIQKEDEPTLLVIPEAVHLTAGFGNVMIAALEQCNELQDRFTIMDLEDNTGNFTTDASSFRTDVGTQYLKYGASYYPWLNTSLQYDDASVKVTYNGIDPTGIGAAITAGGKTLATIIAEATDPNAPDTDLANFIGEQLGAIRNKVAEQVITLSPSSSMAGVYARVDSDRGVWKAPANVSLNGVASPTYKINNADQEGLNVDSTGKSINAIRTFTGKGVIVWGARTLAGNDNEWRYVPVRRLFITIEESVRKATEFVVFEPNDKNTWNRTRTMIENYLTDLWRQGALAGAKPEDAFFVNVGLGQTMTSQDILEGKLIVEVGIAAVRPAEFIILNFSHKLQEA